MRDIGEHGQCVARPLLVALSNEDLAAALADMGEGELRQLFQVLGLRVPPSRLRSAKNSLVSSRLRSLPPSGAHMAALYLTAAGMSPMLDVVSASRSEAGDTTLREGVSRLCELWPKPLMKLLVTVMSEAAMVSPDEGAAVMALLEEGGVVGTSPAVGLDNIDGDGDGGGAEPVLGGEAQSERPPAPPPTVVVAPSVRVEPTVATHLALETDPSAVERVVESAEGRYLSAPLLSAILERDPKWAAELLSRCPLPFSNWGQVLGSLRREAAALIAGGDLIDAELLLRSGDETLSSWAIAIEEASDLLGDEMQAEAAQLCLLRVTCRRARRDFAGAARLMAQLPDHQLPAADQVSANCERTLIAAELPAATELRFPRSGRERRSMLVRLERARRHVDEVLEADPDNLVGRLLAGMHAVCVDDDAAAARDLGLAESALVGMAGSEALVCGIRFHRALCQLRLLEPGTDESSYRQLTEAMTGGYDPLPEWLVAAAEALDAHESPLVAEAISLAASVAPADTAVTAMVCGHARRGTSVVVDLAHRLACDRARSLSSRFALLEAALDGTGAGGQPSVVEQLVDEIDDVVVRACDPGVDERWAALLGRHEGIRLLLDPLHADLLRVDVLRRVGRMEEARELAGRVFYRVAAGGVGGLDAGEVLDLVGALGAGEEELSPMRRLVRAPVELDEQPPPPLERDMRIVFVGGNEAQERYQTAIDAALADRYQGRVVVEWFTPGWGSNWMKAFSRIESRYEAADAVVLMPFVRTLFGRRVRKTAGEAGLPWIACTGHGRDALQRAIERAVAVVAGS